MSKTARKNVADSTVYPERIDFRQAANPPKGISLARSETQSEAQRESPTGQLARACDRHWTPPFMPWFETDFQGSLRVRRLHRVARWIYGDLLRAGWHCDSKHPIFRTMTNNCARSAIVRQAYGRNIARR
jgi:hypothetical protein